MLLGFFWLNIEKKNSLLSGELRLYFVCNVYSSQKCAVEHTRVHTLRTYVKICKRLQRVRHQTLRVPRSILHLPLRSNTCLLCVTHISSAYISSAKTSHMGYNYLQRGQRQAILLSVWEAESWSYLAICIDRYYITCSYSFITNSSGKPCTPGQTDTYSSTHVSHIFISL